jgi:hypothetical protein
MRALRNNEMARWRDREKRKGDFVNQRRYTNNGDLCMKRRKMKHAILTREFLE